MGICCWTVKSCWVCGVCFYMIQKKHLQLFHFWREDPRFQKQWPSLLFWGLISGLFLCWVGAAYLNIFTQMFSWASDHQLVYIHQKRRTASLLHQLRSFSAPNKFFCFFPRQRIPPNKTRYDHGAVYVSHLVFQAILKGIKVFGNAHL